jgi:hypothetical protein
MTGVVAVALLATPSFGLLAQTLNDEPKALADLAAELDARARDELIARGFQPEAAPAERGVEFLVASQPVELALADGSVRCEPAPRAHLSQAMGVVRAELARYPEHFLAATRLKRVLFCEGLREGDVRVPSLPNYERSLLLDADTDKTFLRRLVHHEVFHFADYADDGELRRDAAWERLNDRWFCYGFGGRFLRDGDASHFAEDRAGFVSKYATSALEEDKAEVFSFMMSEPRRLKELAERDAIVAAKMDAVERQLSKLDRALKPRLWIAN